MEAGGDAFGAGGIEGFESEVDVAEIGRSGGYGTENSVGEGGHGVDCGRTFSFQEEWLNFFSFSSLSLSLFSQVFS